MFPFQQLSNPYLNLNLDLQSSQPLSLQSQLLQSQDLARFSHLYHQDQQNPYQNVSSLLQKRPNTMDLTLPAAKQLHQDSFNLNSEAYRLQELSKSLNIQLNSEENAARGLMMRNNQDYNLNKALGALGGQLPSNFGLASQDLASQLELQNLLNGSLNSNYLQQLMDTKGQNGREFNGQLAGKKKEGMGNLLNGLHGLQGAQQAQNLQSLQSLAQLANLGGMDNLGLLDNSALLAATNLGGIGGLGSLGGLGGLSGLGGLNNLGLLNGSMNNPYMMDLLAQQRNQQLLQQQLQAINGMSLLPGLQEGGKRDQGRGAAGLGSLQGFNGSNASNGIVIPDIVMGGESTPKSKLNKNILQGLNGSQDLSSVIPQKNTLVLQKPEPLRNEGFMRKENNLSEKTIQLDAQPIQKMVEESPRGNGINKMDLKLNGEPLDKLSKLRSEQEVELAKPIVNNIEVKGKKTEKTESPNSDSMTQQSTRTNSQSDPIVPERSSKRLATSFAEKTAKRAPLNNPISYKEEKPEIVTRSRRGEIIQPVEVKTTTRASEAEERKTVKTRSSGSESVNMSTRSSSIKEKEVKKPVKEEKNNVKVNLVEQYYQSPKDEKPYDFSEQKITNMRVGWAYNSDIPDLILNEEEDDENLIHKRREVKMVWDPQTISNRELNKYLDTLARIVGIKVVHQEKALKLLAKKDFNVEEAVQVVKKNERYYSNFFGISNCSRELRSRKVVE